MLSLSLLSTKIYCNFLFYCMITRLGGVNGHLVLKYLCGFLHTSAKQFIVFEIENNLVHECMDLNFHLFDLLYYGTLTSCQVKSVIIWAPSSVFEHSVMTNFNCACPAIQRGRDLAFCLKVPLDSLLV